jgi:glyoxylase-like metal-dependent hydrolase (beta-lactamase superfamily II)
VRITEVTPHVFAVEGDAVNWTILRDGDALTLVDAGYPGYTRDVLASLDEVGRARDLEAVLVTHAHVDHIGGLPGLLRRYDVPVLTSPAEVPNARRDVLEQAGPLDLLRIPKRPRSVRWLAHVLRNGAANDRPVPSARAYDLPIDVPGRPHPVPTPGHTSGHVAYLVDGVLLTGDALVTGHPLSPYVGPQRIAEFFHHDRAQAEASLDVIAAVDAHAIVPGHGPVHRGTPAEAVAAARSGKPT